MSAARFAMLVTLAGTAAGCGAARSQEADAALPPDAAVDASTSARLCDPDRPMPDEPTSAGSLEGTWRVSWACSKGCVLRRPGLTYSPQLEVVGSMLRWSNPLCEECRAAFVAAVTVDGCLDVFASADFDSQCRFSYRICEMDGELRGSVTWKEPGVSPTTWQLVGTR